MPLSGSAFVIVFNRTYLNSKSLSAAVVMLLLAWRVQAQSVVVESYFGAEKLRMNTDLVLPNGAAVSISTFRFYVSSVELRSQGAVVWKEPDSYHLMDAEDAATRQLLLPEGTGADELHFLLGTDSLTNVSGAMGGDLDPSKGMYWAWNSGYINFKLEGTSPLCDTRNHTFQFHVGGYAHPFATVQKVALPMFGSTEIVVDVAAFLSAIDLSGTNSIMSPSTESVELAQRIPAIFRFNDED